MVTNKPTSVRPISDGGKGLLNLPATEPPDGRETTMPVWAWILIVIAIVAVIAFIAWTAWSRRRSARLRQQFGPEYDRALTEQGDRRRAESDLTARRKRRDELEIRPLESSARRRYMERWRDVQVRFVDAPGQAVGDADGLVIEVMRECGYPVEDFEERASIVSVDHPNIVHEYRAAHGISLANDNGRASTEDLREAMLHYRSLFDELLEVGQVDQASRTREDADELVDEERMEETG
jgi:ABC-type nickel/cobalt efflux system permease component RcnA